jgi:hypothetical protein
MAGPKPTRRLCRTRDEAFAAGWDDAQNDRPLAVGEAARLAALLRPYLTDKARKTA